MANEQNLTPFTSENREEAVKNGRKGGIASGESKREKKSLKSALLALLEAEHKAKDEEGKEIKRTGWEEVTIGLYKKAIGGDPKAMKLLSELIGEYKLRTDVTSGGEKLGLNISVPNNEVKDKLEQLADELGQNK